MEFTGLCEFLIEVWSVTLLVEHLLVEFLFLEGESYYTFNFLFLWIIRCFPCLLQREISWLHLSSSLHSIYLLHRIGVMPWSGVSFIYNPGSWFIVHVHWGAFNRASLVDHLLSTSLGSPFLWGCLFANASLARLIYFQPPYRIRCSELNYRPSYLWMEYVSGNVVALFRKRRRGKFLVLEMMTHHPLYLLFSWIFE